MEEEAEKEVEIEVAEEEEEEEEEADRRAPSRALVGGDGRRQEEWDGNGLTNENLRIQKKQTDERTRPKKGLPALCCDSSSSTLLRSSRSRWAGVKIGKLLL